jgi:aspartyl-tRNA(Asn)/glutamyl-tRNA(Gln) amidotransferase subunit C
MSTLSLQDVEKIAMLAHLYLTDEEKAKYQKQLSEVLTYVEQLSELDLAGVPQTAHAVEQQNILRDDQVNSTISIGLALRNAAATADDQFAIQAVFDD